MKLLGHTLETCVYSHCNMCNIPIYFCNILMKHMQHLDKTSETLEIYAYNMRFQYNITLLLGRMELNVVELDDGASSSSVRQRSGEHHLREAMSTPGEQEGRGEHLRLARLRPTQVGRAHTVQGTKTTAVP